MIIQKKQISAKEGLSRAAAEAMIAAKKLKPSLKKAK